MALGAHLSESQRREARRHATISALYGCISELMLDSSAVIIIYLLLWGGSNMFSMLSTSLGSIAYMLLLIPMAGINDLLGLKRSVRIACAIGTVSFLAMALAPTFFGANAKYVVIAGAFGYSLAKPLYLNTWYPLIDVFLRPEDRSGFFSSMRFLYMALNAMLFIGIGLIIGKRPPIWLMQIIIGLAGLTIIGRDYYIQKLPEPTNQPRATRYGLIKSLRTSIKNGPLTGFSTYLCFVFLGNALIVPLSFIYLKSHLGAAHNTVITISGLAMVGTIFGYLVSHRVLKVLGTKWVQIGSHVSFMLIAFACFSCGRENPHAVQLITLLLMLYGLVNGCFSVCNSSDMLALARPGNKTMATAFCNTFIQTGIAFSRTGSSLIIGCGLLATSWQFGEREVSSFQTLFLFAGIGLAFCLLLLVLIPAVVPKREDYYEPK